MEHSLQAGDPRNNGQARMNRKAPDDGAKKLERLRSPNAQVFLLQVDEARALYGIAIGLDRGLGRLKRQVPHVFGVEELRTVLERVQALHEEMGEILNANGMGWKEQEGLQGLDGNDVAARERLAAHPRSLVFVPHHNETRRLGVCIEMLNHLLMRCRAMFSVNNADVSVFQRVYRWLDAYDRVVQELNEKVEGNYRPHKLIVQLRERAAASGQGPVDGTSQSESD